MDKNKIIQVATRHVQKGHLDKAIAEYGKILREDPKDVRILLKIGELQQKKGDHATAAKTMLQVAETYSADGFFLKAVAVYKQVLKIADDVEVQLKLAELYQQLGLTKDALAQYQLVSRHHEKAGNTAAAIEAIRRAVDLGPDDLVGRIELAELLAKDGRNGEAVQEFRRAAEALKAQGRADDYLRVGERIVHLDPQDFALARELANLYLARGDSKRALAKLQACFAVNPKHVGTLELLGRTFRELGQAGKAASVFKELARVHQEEGRMDAAREAWLEVLGLSPDDEEARGAVEARFAGPPAAAPARTAGSVPLGRIALKAVGGAPSPAPAPSRGAAPIPAVPPPPADETPAEAIERLLAETDVYVKYGLREKAFEHLRRVLAIDPDCIEAHERASMLFASGGNQTAAWGELVNVCRICADRGWIERGRVHYDRLREEAPHLPELAALADVYLSESQGPAPVAGVGESAAPIPLGPPGLAVGGGAFPLPREPSGPVAGGPSGGVFSLEPSGGPAAASGSGSYRREPSGGVAGSGSFRGEPSGGPAASGSGSYRREPSGGATGSGSFRSEPSGGPVAVGSGSFRLEPSGGPLAGSGSFRPEPSGGAASGSGSYRLEPSGGPVTGSGSFAFEPPGGPGFGGPLGPEISDVIVLEPSRGPGSGPIPGVFALEPSSGPISGGPGAYGFESRGAEPVPPSGSFGPAGDVDDEAMAAAMVSAGAEQLVDDDELAFPGAELFDLEGGEPAAAAPRAEPVPSGVDATSWDDDDDALAAALAAADAEVVEDGDLVLPGEEFDPAGGSVAPEPGEAPAWDAAPELFVGAAGPVELDELDRLPEAPDLAVGGDSPAVAGRPSEEAPGGDFGSFDGLPEGDEALFDLPEDDDIIALPGDSQLDFGEDALVGAPVSGTGEVSAQLDSLADRGIGTGAESSNDEPGAAAESAPSADHEGMAPELGAGTDADGIVLELGSEIDDEGAPGMGAPLDADGIVLDLESAIDDGGAPGIGSTDTDGIVLDLESAIDDGGAPGIESRDADGIVLDLESNLDGGGLQELGSADAGGSVQDLGTAADDGGSGPATVAGGIDVDLGAATDVGGSSPVASAGGLEFEVGAVSDDGRGDSELGTATGTGEVAPEVGSGTDEGGAILELAEAADDAGLAATSELRTHGWTAEDDLASTQVPLGVGPPPEAFAGDEGEAGAGEPADDLASMQVAEEFRPPPDAFAGDEGEPGDDLASTQVAQEYRPPSEAVAGEPGDELASTQVAQEFLPPPEAVAGDDGFETVSDDNHLELANEEGAPGLASTQVALGFQPPPEAGAEEKPATAESGKAAGDASPWDDWAIAVDEADVPAVPDILVDPEKTLVGPVPWPMDLEDPDLVDTRVSFDPPIDMLEPEDEFDSPPTAAEARLPEEPADAEAPPPATHSAEAHHPEADDAGAPPAPPPAPAVLHPEEPADDASSAPPEEIGLEPGELTDLDTELEEARFFLEQGLFAEAEDVCRSVLFRAPGHGEATALLAEITARRAANPPRPAEPGPASAPADIAADIAAELDVDFEEGGMPLDEFQYSVEDVFAAFKKGVSRTVSPEDTQTHYDLGIAYKEMGLLPDAIEQFETARGGCRGQPREVDCLAMIARCLSEQGEHARAIARLDEALALTAADASTRPALLFELAATHEANGDLDTALRYYSQVAQRDPAFPEAGRAAERLKARIGSARKNPLA